MTMTFCWYQNITASDGEFDVITLTESWLKSDGLRIINYYIWTRRQPKTIDSSKYHYCKGSKHFEIEN